MQQITTFKGHNYGIMNGTDDRMIYYNKNVFKKAGLPTTWQPHSWADILKAAQTIKNKEPNVVPMNCYTGVINDEESTMQCFEMLLYGTRDKAPLYDYKTNKWVVSSQGILDTLNMIKTIYDPSDLLGPPEDIALNDQGASIIQRQLMPQDKIGIDMDGSWVPNTWVADWWPAMGKLAEGRRRSQDADRVWSGFRLCDHVRWMGLLHQCQVQEPRCGFRGAQGG